MTRMRQRWRGFLAAGLALAALLGPRGGWAEDFDDWYQGATGYVDGVLDARDDERPIVVYFHATWCGYCKRFNQNVLATSEVDEFLQNFVRVVIDIDDGPQAKRLADKYGVRGVPSFFVHARSSSSPRRVSHGVSPAQFMRVCRSLVER